MTGPETNMEITLLTVPYFSVRWSGSSALRYGQPPSMSVTKVVLILIQDGCPERKALDPDHLTEK